MEELRTIGKVSKDNVIKNSFYSSTERTQSGPSRLCQGREVNGMDKRRQLILLRACFVCQQPSANLGGLEYVQEPSTVLQQAVQLALHLLPSIVRIFYLLLVHSFGRRVSGKPPADLDVNSGCQKMQSMPRKREAWHVGGYPLGSPPYSKSKVGWTVNCKTNKTMQQTRPENALASTLVSGRYALA